MARTHPAVWIHVAVSLLSLPMCLGNELGALERKLPLCLSEVRLLYLEAPL